MAIWHLSRKENPQVSRQKVKCPMPCWISWACITSLHLHVLLSLEELSHQQTGKEVLLLLTVTISKCSTGYPLPIGAEDQNPVLSALPMVPKA